MNPDRAWVRLGSGKRLDLICPQPDQWDDRDLAISLSRTYRWGGHSRWELPMSVAQHSLLVLVLRQRMQPHRRLTPREALREVLHDGEEALCGGLDVLTPIKPYLGSEFHALTARLRAAIAIRYALPDWTREDYALHKQADHLAAASEAMNVAGWDALEVSDTLGIQVAPLWDDPLPLLDGLRPWEPWPAPTAAALFLAKLRELDGAAYVEAPADLAGMMEREATLARLGAAFSRLPPGKRRRCARPLTGNSLTDTFVFVEADDISQQHIEGVIVDGERDEDGQWLLDGEFTVFTTDEELVVVAGWNCTTEIQ